MQTIPASVILEDAYRLIGWDPAELDPREVAMARQAFSLALQEVWERYWWEELMVSKQTLFAGDAPEPYPNGTVLTNGTAAHSLFSDAYYVNLWPAGPPVIPTGKSLVTDYGYNPGSPTSPAIAPVTTNTDNLYGWAKYDPRKNCQALPIWNAQMNPALGDQVQWQGNGFQWCTDQGYLPNNLPDPTKVYAPFAVNPGWVVVPKWTPTLPYNSALMLVPVIKGYFGDIYAVTKSEFPNAPHQFQFPFRPSDDGSAVVIPDWTQGAAWIYARRPTPIITGDPYVSTQAYDATSPNDLVWDS